MLTPERRALLEKKIADSKKVIHEALDRYAVQDLAIAWTGGKDSTLTLHLIRQVCAERGLPVPKAFCIDEGDMFDEIRQFLARLSQEWGVTLELIHNHDVSKAAGGVLGAAVKVSALNERNRREVERLGYDEPEFSYEPESYVGNHLMKTATLNAYLEDRHVRGFFAGIRWDEQSARENDDYFGLRPATPYSPEHMRISPILHFAERDIWDTYFMLGLPFCPLYQQGYRSLGARVTTHKAADIPAWEQDLENTNERGGRRQDKEALMGRLRDLGYM